MTKRNNSIEEMANQAECPDPKKLVALPTGFEPVLPP